MEESRHDHDTPIEQTTFLVEHDGSEDSEYNPEEEKRDYEMDDTQPSSNDWNQSTRTPGGFDPDAVQTAGTRERECVCVCMNESW